MKITAEIIETDVGGRASINTFVSENEITIKKGDVDLDVKYMTCAALFLEAVLQDMTSDKEKAKKFLKVICKVTEEELDGVEKRVVRISREGEE